MRPNPVPDDWDQIVAQLRQRRRQQRMSQHRLSAQLGCYTNVVYAWETQRRIPCIQDWMRWAAALGVVVGQEERQ